MKSRDNEKKKEGIFFLKEERKKGYREAY